jgi:hypothetical protein
MIFLVFLKLGVIEQVAKNHQVKNVFCFQGTLVVMVSNPWNLKYILMYNTMLNRSNFAPQPGVSETCLARSHIFNSPYLNREGWCDFPHCQDSAFSS